MNARASKRNSWRGQKAYDMWVVVQATEEETCDAAQITARTLRKWRNAENWDEERERFGAGMGCLLSTLREQLGQAAQHLRSAIANKDTDQVKELNKAINMLLTNSVRVQEIERSVHYRRMALQFTRELSEFLKDRKPLLLEELIPELKAFMAEIARAA